MRKILKNIIPYWKTVILIIALLAVQAYCDLALPTYTSDIIDVGIKNSGVEHIVPTKMTEREFNEAQIFMKDSEKKLWNEIYDKDGEFYDLNVTDEEKLDEIDNKLMTAVVLTYQVGHMEESSFREIVKGVMAKNPQTRAFVDKVDEMSLDDIEKTLDVGIDSFTEEDENGKEAVYVDVREIMGDMVASGQMDDSMITQSRETLEKTMESIGTDTVKSMGVAYAVSCNKEAGIDVEDNQMSYLWSTGAKMLLMAVVMVLAAVLVSFFAAKVGAGIGRDLRNKVFRNVIGFSNREMNHFSTASLITRNTNDVQQIQMVTSVLLRMLLYSPILAIGGIYKVWQTGANMGWIITLAVIVILGFVMLLVSIAMPKFKIMQQLVDALNLVAREILTGLSVIRAFGREEKEEERFDAANRDLMKTQLFTNRVMTFMMPGMMLIMNCLVVLITWVSAHRIDDGTLQVGMMTAFITYSMLIVLSFLMMTVMSIMIPRAGVAAERIDEVINTQISIKDPEEPVKLSDVKGIIEFDNVSFRYPGASADTIKNVSFKAEPGKVTAIIGSTGAGKSATVDLIPRFYDVTEGSIKLDGVDIRDLSLKDLRAAIGFVPQKGVLFSGTIASNLRFGNESATDEEIENAAKISQAEDFILAKDMKYDEHISQGGSNVSGGQKQRLAIARAIAKDPKIFVFDDSFSALDMKTDAALRKALGKHVNDSTEIIVAQRISTILHADQIIVLDDGNVVGIGTHNELIRNCSVYREIAESQLSAREMEKLTEEVTLNE